MIEQLKMYGLGVGGRMYDEWLWMGCWCGVEMAEFDREDVENVM